MIKDNLKLDWCSHEAAKFAVEHWHYSRVMPVGKTVKAGVWEGGKFIGVVIFARGANCNIASPYGVSQMQVCELVRVALTEHKTPVSRIVSIVLRMLVKQSPGLRLIVSYADPMQDHHGGIYQAGNWVYSGATSKDFNFIFNGVRRHRRTYTGSNRIQLPTNAEKSESMPKHRYLYPLDDAMRKQIEPLRKPYPKKAKCASEVTDSGTPVHQPEGALQCDPDALFNPARVEK